MTIRKTVLLTAVVVAALAFASLFEAAPLRAQQRQELPTRLAVPAGIKPISRLPGSQQLRLALTLRLRNQQELLALLHDLYDPGSPRYRQFLSAEEFTEQFGPTVDDYKKVMDYAAANGLAVTHTAPNRLVLDICGPVSAVENAFGVTMQVYQHPTEPRTFFAPNVEPSLDPGIPVQGIEGLSDFERPHPADSRFASAAQNPAPNGTGSAPGGSYLGSDIRAAYAPGVALDGSGQTVGLLEFEAYNLSDVELYFNNAKQPLKVPIVTALLDGVSGECGTGCYDGEAALDIELAISMAPNLSGVVVYEGVYDADILNEMATDNIAKQLSNSYVWGVDYSAIDPIFQEFALQGQNFFTASADAGATTPLCTGISSVCNPSRFPSVDAYVTSVGGTILTTNAAGAWQSETAWPQSGGGVSSYSFPIPSYQAPLINSSNQGSTTTRNYPDVAAVAQGLYFCENGGCAIAAGTSASTPIWAGFLALANQQAGSPIGFVNPIIYGIALGSNYGNDFHDITTGNNFNPASPNLYSAVPGYDLVTGLGSPNGQNLINALAPTSVGADFTLASAPSTLTVTPGGQATVTVTVTPANGFSGNVSFRASFLGQSTGITASFSPALITGAGTTTVTISANNVPLGPSLAVAITGTSGSSSHTAYFTLSVLMPSLVETAVSAPPASVKAGDTFSVTDTTQNTGQAPAGASVTGYYLSATPTKTVNSHLLGTRSVPALAVNSTSRATGTVAVPSGLWPNTPYLVVACANDTGVVVELPANNCVASTASAILNQPTPPSTTTAIAMTAGGSPVTTMPAGTAVTLTATVLTGTTAVNPGIVNFCNATAARCADIHVLGTAQLTTAGTATLKFIPAIGNHSYKAVFAGTVAAASSSSSTVALTVTGTFPTTTTIGVSGTAGNYTLTASLAGSGPAPASGQISFLDTSAANAVLSTASLVPAVPPMNWTLSESVTPGVEPASVAVGDFNGDGIPDLAIANFNDCNVAILLGNGDGTFTAAAKPTVECYPTAVTVADFNGDGKEDLAVVVGVPSTSAGQSGLTPGSVAILLGNGDGTFTPVSATSATGIAPRAIAVGDFNGDGKADLAVANFYPTGLTFELTILLGNGDGTFTAAAPAEGPATGFLPFSLAVGDFNGDGKMDLAVGNDALVGATILLGNGDGTFTAAANADPGGAPLTVVTGDFNGDGKLDLAVGDFADNTVRILLGNGDGTFKLTNTLPTGGVDPFALAVGDFNGDGIADLVLSNVESETISTFLGNGDGTFTTASAGPAAGIYPQAIAAADFTGDGTAGLVIVNKFSNMTISLTQFTSNATASGISPLGTGTHLVDASYPGDSSHNSSVSATTALTAAQFSLAPRNLTFGVQIVLTTSASQAVTFSNMAASPLFITGVTASANFSQTNNCGSSLAANSSCTINVIFAPTTGGSLSGTITVTDNVNGVAGSMQTVALSGTAEDFSFSPAAGSSTSATVAQGQTATFTLNLGSESGLTGSVSFNITGAPSESTCTASPNPANLGTAVTVSCTTTQPVALLLPGRPFPPFSRLSPMPVGLWILALTLLVASWTLMNRRQLPGSRAAVVTAYLAVALLVIVVVGCGGGATHGGPPPNPGTPAGTYPLTLNGTISSGSSSLSHSVRLTLTVT